MILKKNDPLPEPPPRRFNDDELRDLGGLVVRAVRGDVQALRDVEGLLRAARAHLLDILTPAEAELAERLADQAPAPLSSEELAAEAAWPEDVLLALVSIGDLPSLFLTKPPADDRQEGRTE